MLLDLGVALRWEDVHKAKPRPRLTWRACTGAMAAKVPTLGTPVFAHVRRPDGCNLAYESSSPGFSRAPGAS